MRALLSSTSLMTLFAADADGVYRGQQYTLGFQVARGKCTVDSVRHLLYYT